MKTLFLLLGGLLLSAPALMAQGAPADLNSLSIKEQPLPDGDLLTSRATDPSQWTITAVPLANEKPVAGGAPATSAAASTGKSAVGISVTKSGVIYLVEFTNPGGSKTICWKEGGLQATYPHGSKKALIDFDPSAHHYIDFSKSDYPEFYWLSARNYVGVTKIGGAIALVFKAKIRSSGAQMGLLAFPHHTQSAAIAVVEMETRRPMLLQVGNELRTYSKETPAQELTLPKPVKDAFSGLSKQLKRAALLPPG